MKMLTYGAAALGVVLIVVMAGAYLVTRAERDRAEVAKKAESEAARKAEEALAKALEEQRRAEAARAAEAEATRKTALAEKAEGEQRQRADTEAERALRDAYFLQIADAYRLTQEGNMQEAANVLRNISPKLRNWEYRHLWRLATHQDYQMAGESQLMGEGNFNGEFLLSGNGSCLLFRGTKEGTDKKLLVTAIDVLSGKKKNLDVDTHDKWGSAGNHAVLAPDGAHVALVDSRLGRFGVWNIATGASVLRGNLLDGWGQEVMDVLPDHWMSAVRGRFFSDGQHFAMSHIEKGTSNHCVSVWNFDNTRPEAVKMLSYRWPSESVVTDPSPGAANEEKKGRSVIRDFDVFPDNSKVVAIVAMLREKQTSGLGVEGLIPDREMLVVWDVASQRQLRAIPIHAETKGLTISPDGSCLVLIEGSGHRGKRQTLEVLDTKSWSAVKQIDVASGTQPVLSALFSPDARQLALNCGPLVRFVDMELEKVTMQLKQRDWDVFVAIGYNAEGNIFYMCAKNGLLRKWKPRPAVIAYRLGNFAKKQGRIFGISPSSKYLANAMGVWDWDERKLIEKIDKTVFEGWHGKISFLSDEIFCYVVADEFGWAKNEFVLKKVRGENLGSVRLPDTTLEGGTPISISTSNLQPTFSPNGRYCAQVVPETKGEKPDYWPIHLQVFELPENLSEAQNPVDIELKNPIFSRKIGAGYCGVPAFAPDGTYVVASGVETHRFAIPSGEEILPSYVCRYEGETHCVDPVAFSGDGRFVAFGGNSGRIFLFDAKSAKCLLVLKGSDNASVVSLSFTPDGTRLASGDTDGVITLWDVVSGRSILKMFGGGEVPQVQFSPDGVKLVMSCDTGIEVWEAPLPPPPSQAKPVADQAP
jgi:WD40 repeat protein